MMGRPMLLKSQMSYCTTIPSIIEEKTPLEGWMLKLASHKRNNSSIYKHRVVPSMRVLRLLLKLANSIILLETLLGFIQISSWI
jgi:hypothetical protein